jgi:hypothetical protein
MSSRFTVLGVLASSILVVLALTVALRTLRSPDPAEAPSPWRRPTPDPHVFLIRGSDFYVRLDPQRRAVMLESVRSAVTGSGTLYEKDAHAVVLWHDFNPPEGLLERLSRDLRTQVIWLSFQKQVDAFGFLHWENGSRVRRLVYGCYEKERTWEQVDGTPEAWEAAAIFDQARLERRLARAREWAREGIRELGNTPEEEARLRAIWRERRLAVDSDEPGIDGRDVAETVAIAYGLPGW